jgi:hypothetical protein
MLKLNHHQQPGVLPLKYTHPYSILTALMIRHQVQEVASWKAVHKAFVSPAQRFAGGGVKAGPHPDAITISRPRYLYLQYQGHLKGGSLSMIKHISFELTTAFDKSRVVNGTLARGGAFLPELAKK